MIYSYVDKSHFVVACDCGCKAEASCLVENLPRRAPVVKWDDGTGAAQQEMHDAVMAIHRAHRPQPYAWTEDVHVMSHGVMYGYAAP